MIPTLNPPGTSGTILWPAVKVEVFVTRLDTTRNHPIQKQQLEGVATSDEVSHSILPFPQKMKSQECIERLTLGFSISFHLQIIWDSLRISVLAYWFRLLQYNTALLPVSGSDLLNMRKGCFFPQKDVFPSHSKSVAYWLQLLCLVFGVNDWLQVAQMLVPFC